MPGLLKLLREVLAARVAVVFGPRRHHDCAADEHEHDRGVKGRDATEVHLLDEEIAQETRQDRHQAIAQEHRPGEGLVQGLLCGFGSWRQRNRTCSKEGSTHVERLLCPSYLFPTCCKGAVAR